MRGIGDAYLATTELNSAVATAQLLLPNPFFTFSYAADVTTIEASGFVSGRQQTVASAAGQTTHNLTLETQYIKRSTRPLQTRHVAKSFTSVIFPIRVDGVVPAGSPYEISDAAITAGNTNYILVYDDTSGPLTRTASATTAPANATEVQVNTTTNKLIFHATAAGRSITYTKPYTFTGKGYGGDGAATELGTLAFRAKVFDFGAEFSYIEFPSISLTNVVELPITGDVPTFSLEFLAAVPSGWSHPYRLLEVATAA
jgi:hypothetical protein